MKQPQPRPETAQDQQDEILARKVFPAPRATWDKLVKKKGGSKTARPADQLQTEQQRVLPAKKARSPSAKAPWNPQVNPPGTFQE